MCSNQTGGWSTEGLTVDRSQSNEMSVTCTTTHLTSFAVLVSIQDERPVRIEYSVITRCVIIACFSHLQLIKHCQLSHILDVPYL